jgi:hypothetical protein
MIMVDLEGTLSDHSIRLATLLENEEKYKKRDRTAWKEYYKGLIDDPPRKHIMELVREYIAEDIRPLIYSTRFVNKYKHEEEWLKLHGLWDEVDLLQREPHMTKIKGPDLVLQWVRQYDPIFIVDDREEVRELVRGLGTACVAYGPNAFLNLEGE